MTAPASRATTNDQPVKPDSSTTQQLYALHYQQTLNTMKNLSLLQPFE